MSKVLIGILLPSAYLTKFHPVNSNITKKVPSILSIEVFQRSIRVTEKVQKNPMVFPEDKRLSCMCK